MEFPSVSVITATVGSHHLRECLVSVQAQTYRGRLDHYVIVDGAEHARDVEMSIGKLSAPLSRCVHVITIPINTGGSGYLCHRIIGGMSFLADGEYVAYLDEDNAYEPDHIERLLSAMGASPGGAVWAHSLRSIVDEHGAHICIDNCESLGGLCKTILGDYLIDTNCYILKRDLAVELSPLWHVKARDPCGAMEGDRAVTRALLASSAAGSAPHAVSRAATVRYRVGNRADSVRAEFFLRGNEAMGYDFTSGKKDVYVFHFTADATAQFLKCRTDDVSERAFDEWNMTMYRGLCDTYNIIDGFKNIATIPTGAICIASLWHPDALPLHFFEQRKDVRRICVTCEGPNIRHQRQWTASFLTKYFDIVLTYWKPLLRAPPGNLRAVWCPHNSHHLSRESIPRAVVRNLGSGRSVGMVLERRDLHGTYVIDGTSLKCLDPLRVQYAIGMRDLTVHGVNWDSVPGIARVGHALHRSKDPQSSVDILKSYVFALIIENCDAEGYVSEKIYDALIAGCIPLYYASGMVQDLEIPAECYVDIRKYSNGEELQAYIDGVSDDDIQTMRASIISMREHILEGVGLEKFAERLQKAIAID